MSSLEKLEALAKAATPGNLDTVNDPPDEYGGKEEDWYTCPACDGNGEIDGVSYFNFDGFAMGVQFFGIGNEFGNYEAFFRAANPQAILSLLAHHRQLIERVEVLEGEKERISKDKFDAGYLLATANIVHLHGEDTLAEDVLKEHNACDTKTIKRLNLTDYDANVLRPLFREIDRKAKLPPRKSLAPITPPNGGE